MNKYYEFLKIVRVAILGIIPLLLCSVYYPPEEVEIEYEPIIMKRSDMEQSVGFQPVRDLSDPGKIYLKDNYILINERYKGIHIVDNTQPSSPQKIGFIRIPGCQDMAVLGNYLYADNAIDLITIDISSLPTIIVTSRIKNIYPELLPPDCDEMPSIYKKENRPDNTIIIEWIKIGSES